MNTTISELESLIVETAVRKAQHEARLKIQDLYDKMDWLFPSKSFFGTGHIWPEGVEEASNVIREACMKAHEDYARETAISDFVAKYNSL